MRQTIAVVVFLAVACAPSRTRNLVFTGNDADIDRIETVEVEVYDGALCRCVDLESKPGCARTDARAMLTLTRGSDEDVAGSLPTGAITVRVRARDRANAAVALRIDCWCNTSASDLVFALGSPRDPNGAGCAADLGP